MTLTEEEAKTKWCPFARAPGYVGTELVMGNRRAGIAEQYPLPNGTMCLGSACMSWRWQPLMADESYIAAIKRAAADIADTSPNRHKAAAHVNAHRAEYGLPERPFRGWCGLAGEPK